jgi:hypothetical protein
VNGETRPKNQRRSSRYALTSKQSSAASLPGVGELDPVRDDVAGARVQQHFV